MSALRNPFTASLAILAAGAVAGLLTLIVSWRGLAATAEIFRQLPFLVSGAVGGLALGGFAAGVLAIQERRLEAAHRHAELDALLGCARELVDAARGQETGR